MGNATQRTTAKLLKAIVAVLACTAMAGLTPAAYATAEGDAAAKTAQSVQTAQGAGVADGTSGDAGSATSGTVVKTVDGGAGGGASGGSGAGADGANGGATQIAGPVPNIIITNFSYGDNSVSVGSDFNLSFTFQNMGKVAIDNLVVTVDGGESFAIAGGTNTFYFDTLYAGWAMTQSLPMQALSSAKSGAQGVTVSFKYEYVDGGVRSASSSDIKISVPVSQPDRFQLADPVLPEHVNAGEENTITMDYVNKGKGDISNVEATIEGEGIESSVKTQYVGNVASGANGSIGFAFTPTTAGDISAKLRVIYEDSDGKTQTKEFPITISAQEPAPMDHGNIDPDTGLPYDDPSASQQAGFPLWGWVAIVAAIVVVIVMAIVLVRRRKKAKGKHGGIDEEWDDWESGSVSGAASGAAGADNAAGPAAQADGAPTQIIADRPVAGDGPASGPAAAPSAS